MTKSAVPESMFPSRCVSPPTTKHDISLKELREAKAVGVSLGVVLADTSYGNKTRYREALSEMGITCLRKLPAEGHSEIVDSPTRGELNEKVEV